ncbi:MAG: prepilin-type N-terminal cleavage/methylation domain-containing protein [Candidatus Hydrothermales bacterium]
MEPGGKANFCRSGLTLIELLVSITIFGILFVGLLNALFFGLEANILNSQRIRAREIMTSHLDYLKNLPPDHPHIQDVRPGNGLFNLNNFDHLLVLDDRVTGMTWRIIWNIERDPQDPDLYDIRVFVLWRNDRFFVTAQTSYYRGGR